MGRIKCGDETTQTLYSGTDIIKAINSCYTTMMETDTGLTAQEKPECKLICGVLIFLESYLNTRFTTKTTVNAKASFKTDKYFLIITITIKDTDRAPQINERYMYDGEDDKVYQTTALDRVKYMTYVMRRELFWDAFKDAIHQRVDEAEHMSMDEEEEEEEEDGEGSEAGSSGEDSSGEYSDSESD